MPDILEFQQQHIEQALALWDSTEHIGLSESGDPVSISGSPVDGSVATICASIQHGLPNLERVRHGKIPATIAFVVT